MRETRRRGVPSPDVGSGRVGGRCKNAPVSRAEVLRRIAEVGLVPVVRAQSSDEAMRAIDAIREGGVRIVKEARAGA